MRHPDVIESLQIKEEMLAENQARIAQLEARIISLQQDWKSDCDRLTQERDAAKEQLEQSRTELADLNRWIHEEAPQIAVKESRKAIEQANARAEKAEAERDQLKQELGYIANAKHGNIECEFRAWAQNRARHAIGQEPGTLVIKKEKEKA